MDASTDGRAMGRQRQRLTWGGSPPRWWRNSVIQVEELFVGENKTEELGTFGWRNYLIGKHGAEELGIPF